MPQRRHIARNTVYRYTLQAFVLGKNHQIFNQKNSKDLVTLQSYFFTLSVSNFLSAKHQTLLKIVCIFRRLVFGHCTMESLEKHHLSKKGFGPLSLQKITKFFIRRLQKRCLHCDHILFSLSVSNFLTGKHQTLLKIEKASGFYP